MSFEKQAIFSLIDVSGSMKSAYSKNYSNSKIESLTETIRNIIFSKNLLGSEKDIDFYSLIFGASKYNDWLNALELLNIAIENNGFQNFDNINSQKFDIETIKSDPKYDCSNPKQEIIKLLNDEGAIDIDRYMNQLPSEDYLHVLVYYLKKDRVLLKEVYQRLPDCHKAIKLKFTQSSFVNFFYVHFQIINMHKNAAYRTVAQFMNWEKEVKEHYDFIVEKVKEKIIEEKKEKIIEEKIEEIKKIKGDSIYNLRKKFSSFFDSSSKKIF